jgi:hypothetical protein
MKDNGESMIQLTDNWNQYTEIYGDMNPEY